MLIVSVTERSHKFHYVYWDMTTGLLINVHRLTVKAYDIGIMG